METCVRRMAAIVAIALVLLGQALDPLATRVVYAVDQFQVSPQSGIPGTVVTISGYAGTLPPSATERIVFVDRTGTNEALGLLQSGLDGSFSRTVTIPVPASGGLAEIALEGATTITAHFQVLPVLTVTPATPAPGVTVTVTGNGYVAYKPISLSLDSNLVVASVPGGVNALGGFTVSFTLSPALAGGTHILVANDGTTASSQASAQFTIVAPTATPPFTTTPPPTATGTPTVTGMPTSSPAPTGAPSATPAPSGPTTAYFAEGYTGLASTNGKATFSETLTLLNPNPTVAPVSITYYIAGAPAPQVVSRLLPPSACLREQVNADIGPDKLVSAVVTSPQRIYVSRTIMRVSASGSRLDGSTTGAARAPSTRWDFPEGYTGISFQEYLTLLNPSLAPATVHVALAPQAPTAAGASTLTLTVPAQARVTVNVRALNRGSARSVGMLVSSTIPVVAERVEYFGDGAGSGKFGSTVGTGLTTPATDLHIAYGASGGALRSAGNALQPAGDQQYVTMLNPGATTAAVTAHIVDAAGQPIGHPMVVFLAPDTRRTLAVTIALGGTIVSPFSMVLHATQPIAAEAAQYYGGSPNAGTHPGIALPAFDGALTDAYLTELGNRLADGTAVSHLIYLTNPGAGAIQVIATYFGGSGATVQQTYTVPAGGITPVAVNQETQAVIAPGAIGAELKLSAGSGGFLAVAIGHTGDGLSATEETAVPAS